MYDKTKNTYKLMYRCRLCGEEFSILEIVERKIKLGKYIMRLTSSEYSTRIRSENNKSDLQANYIYKEEAHFCRNGGIGMSDVIGFAICEKKKGDENELDLQDEKQTY